MKISIDTLQDSKEEIRKAIRLLQSLVEHEHSSGSRNIFDSPSPDLFGNSQGSQPASSPTTAFGSLFGDDDGVQKPSQGDLKKNGEFPQVELY